MIAKIELFTKEGLTRLGDLLLQARSDRGMSQRQLAAYIESVTGHKISDRTIGNLENNTGIPTHDTLAAIAASKIMRYTKYELIDIACGSRN
jgi:transcriptional regulator with XRE-family HTH domain